MFSIPNAPNALIDFLAYLRSVLSPKSICTYACFYRSGEEIEITFSYWDGSGHRKTVKVWHTGRDEMFRQSFPLFVALMLSSCFISDSDEEGKHDAELSAEGPGSPKEGLQRAQVRGGDDLIWFVGVRVRGHDLLFDN